MAGHISRRSDGRWRARYPDPTKGPTGQHEKTFRRKTDAESWLTDQRHSVKHGTHIAPSDAKTPLSVIVDEWRSTWQVTPKTAQGYDSILSQHIIPQWGSVKVSSITPDALQLWENALASTRQPSTIRNIHNVMRAVLDLAEARKYIPSNPTQHVNLPTNPHTTQLFLTASELRALVNAMPEHWRLPTLVAGLVGLRAGELWGLTRQDVDLANQELHVNYALKDIGGALQAGSTKTHTRRKPSIPGPLIADLTAALENPGVKVRKVRRVNAGGPAIPVAQRVITGGPAITHAPGVLPHAVIARHAHRGGYPAIIGGELTWTDDATSPDRLLFTTKAGTAVLHTNFYERIFRPTVTKLWPKGHRLHDLRWHDLRHTCASLSLAATGSLHVVKSRLGHKDIRTTINIYGHLTPSVDAALADALGVMWDATEPTNVVDPQSNVVQLHPKDAA